MIPAYREAEGVECPGSYQMTVPWRRPWATRATGRTGPHRKGLPNLPSAGSAAKGGRAGGCKPPQPLAEKVQINHSRRFGQRVSGVEGFDPAEHEEDHAGRGHNITLRGSRLYEWHQAAGPLRHLVAAAAACQWHRRALLLRAGLAAGLGRRRAAVTPGEQGEEAGC